jgi:methyltransferase (TIGR00027 family)
VGGDVQTMHHISDTALWVAVYRAMETARPDAIFRDPYAEQLAGERGRFIVDALPHGRDRAWTMIVRTAVFDEIILDAVGVKHAKLVLNLAAGLDTRPWRLELPSTLEWIDVDLPDILRYKTDALASARPRCGYQAIPLDLADRAKRRTLLEKVGGMASPVLVVTEGLLIYLSTDQVASLADDFRLIPAFRWWLTDIVSPALLAMLQAQGDWGESVAQANAPFKFAPSEGTRFFGPHGWSELEYRSTFEEAQRLQRLPPPPPLAPGEVAPPMPSMDEIRRFAGVVLLERSS